MAIPIVTCGADVVLSYSVNSQNVSLSASAINGPITAWKWTMLSVPPGSTAHIGGNGDFYDGESTEQNPTFACDAGVDGGYVIQCVATSAEGDSDPIADARHAQQSVIVLTQACQLWLPGDYQFDWGSKYLNPTLRRIETFLASVGKEPEPFWEWNGNDLSQFNIYEGSGIINGNVSRISLGDVPWININFGTGHGGGTGWWDLSLILVANDFDPPSENYHLKADILIPAGENDRVLLGVRGVFDSGWPLFKGYNIVVNNDVGGAGAREARLWAHWGNEGRRDLAVQTLEPSPFDNLIGSSPAAFGGTFSVGAEGIGPRNTLVNFEGRQKMSVLDKGETPGFNPVVEAGVPFIGGYAFVGASPNFLISNIRAYEYRPRAGTAGQEDTWP